MKFLLQQLLAVPSFCIYVAAALKSQGFLGRLEQEIATLTSDHSAVRRSFCETGDGWVSEWSDEFDGDKLDSSSWEPITSFGRNSHPAPVAGLDVTACRSAQCRAENVRVLDGALRLTSERSANDSSMFYTGAVTTKGKRGWADDQPYRMCVSARLPRGAGDSHGLWPAIWMLPDDGISDKCLDEGEVDIMEMINGDGRVYSTYHWMSSWPREKCASFDDYHKSVASESYPGTWSNKFHEYAIERSSDRIDFVIDGRVVRSVDTDINEGRVLSHSPFFLILNTAIGGSWPGEPSMNTDMPVEHAIDYVRVVRKSDQKTSFLQLQGGLPECIYINLASRADRQFRLESELKRAGVPCTRMEAVASPISGREGCRMSHLKALQQIQASGAPYGLVLEDDAVWNQDVGKVNEILSHIEEGMKTHPVILLACNGWGTPADKPWLLAVQDCQTTSAYIVRRDYIPTLTHLWEFEASHANPVDIAWKKLQRQDGWAMTEPKLMIQGASYSDIEGRHVDYGVFHLLNQSNHTTPGVFHLVNQSNHTKTELH